MSQAKAAVFVEAGKEFDVRDYEIGEPGEGYALLKLKASGICGTDIHIADGKLPFPGSVIIGHEFIGVIEKLGDKVETDHHGNILSVGDIVIACIALSCGSCVNCINNETASCMNFGVTNSGNPDEAPHFWGGFGEYLYQPAHALAKIPDGVEVMAAASFPCAGPTAIRAFTYGGGLKEGELVVVQGLGPVGLFAVAWAAKKGCRVIAIGSGKSPERIVKAEAFGAMEVIDYRKVAAEERLKKILAVAEKESGANGADVVFEASGSPAAIPEGMNLLRTRGRYLIPGQYSCSGGIEINPEMITFKALQLIGSGQYTMDDIVSYLDFLKNDKDVSDEFASCITGKYKVCEINKALEAVRNGEGIKTILV